MRMVNPRPYVPGTEAGPASKYGLGWAARACWRSEKGTKATFSARQQQQRASLVMQELSAKLVSRSPQFTRELEA